MKRLFLGVVAAIVALVMAGCDDATIASQNLSRAADQFEVYRRVVFYNGITDEYILVVEGFASIEVDTADNQLELTVKTDDGKFLKHFLGLSDNVTYFAEQLEPKGVSVYHYRVIFKPQSILPDVDFRGDVGAAGEALTPDSRD